MEGGLFLSFNPYAISFALYSFPFLTKYDIIKHYSKAFKSFNPKNKYIKNNNIYFMIIQMT